MTKPITAVGAMILLEECRLRLDDPVDEWLPELKDRRVLRTIESPLDDTIPAMRRMTLRDLFTFRSGYGKVGFVSARCPLQRAMSEARLTLAEWPFTVTPDEFLQRLGKLPLAHQPGERWRLPVCYGRAFPMAPQYDMRGGITGQLVVLHEARNGYFARPPVFESGGGVLVSTADDMAAFGRMLLNKGTFGRERILSRVSIELMTMDHLTPEKKAVLAVL